MQAVIMAGGRGSRLMPLTENKPKPLMPILDKPIIIYILDLIKKANIKEVAITLGYLGNEIRKEVGKGEQYGLNIEYFNEAVPLGTAGGVKNTSRFLHEEFVVISGDAYTNIDLNELIIYHKQRGGLLSLAAKRVQNPSSFGVVLSDEKGKIIGFDEKPLFPRSNLVNTGIYVTSPRIFSHISDGYCDFSKNVFPKLLGSLYCYTGDFDWSDIGTLESYYNANLEAALQYERDRRIDRIIPKYPHYSLK